MLDVLRPYRFGKGSARLRLLLNSCALALRIVLDLIGQHPLAVLPLPSLWFFARYLPFWKSSDVLCQLWTPFTGENILLVPPIYCVVGRIPFWLTDTVLHGASPSIFAAQHPSLAAVYALIALQHAGLWFALRYFVVTLPATPTGRGVVTILLTSIASFYSFAHTAGAEATTAITWFTVFGAGLRILDGRATWKTWSLYALVLLLCIGSRHVSALLLSWLPVTALLLMLFDYCRRKGASGPSRLGKIAGIAVVLGIAVFGIENAIVAALCSRFGITQRQMVGRTLCERVGSYLDRLSPAEKEKVRLRVSRPDDDPSLQLAIDSLIRIGTYYQGTNDVIARAIRKTSMHGDRLEAEVDRNTLKAALRFYETLDPRLLTVIFKDVVRGFYPTNDHAIALTGPKATFYSVADIAKEPESWAGIRALEFFNPAVARATLQRALHDNYIRHWRFLPIAAWCVLFAAIGLWRLARGKVTLELALAAFCIFGIGFVVYIATCVCNITQPRYVLPLWVATVAAGCVLIGGASPRNRQGRASPRDR
ncbi:MAG TPA: hypothetical protein VE860_12060 [Chthoniobacterales bacterium]|nr:hypothetical protein [Chthoniobacterales bacterium]